MIRSDDCLELDRRLQLINTISSDDTIIKENYTIIGPNIGSGYSNNDTINFETQSTNLLTYPSESYIFLDVTCLNTDGSILEYDDSAKDSSILTLVNNAPLFLFENASYTLDSTTIEEINNPGCASLIKGPESDSDKFFCQSNSKKCNYSLRDTCFFDKAAKAAGAARFSVSAR